MRPDHDIHGAALEPAGGICCLFRAAEPRQHVHAHGIVGQPLAERAAVLLGENGGGNEHRHLLPSLHRLERRAEGDFRLAVAHIPDEQAIHRPRALHVALHLFGGAPLVGRVFIKEGRLELPLPRGIGWERVAGRELAPRVQLEQLHRHLADGSAGLVALALPGGGAELVQPRGLGGRPAVPVRGGPIRLELVQTVQRYVQPVSPFVLDDRHLEAAAVGTHRDRLDAAIDADPVLQVHHVVAHLERLRRRRQRLAVAAWPPQATRPAEDLVIGQDP